MPAVKLTAKWSTMQRMAKYVDGFLIPIPTKNLAAYKKLAKKASTVWLDHGALAYYETTGDEMTVKGVGSFAKVSKAKPSETVILSWIVYKSKTHRNAVNKKVMNDPRIANFDPAIMPFDSKKMVYGGFKVLIEGAAK
jgi:uncharacterized protein YbaA (DUF1428 family)